MTRADRHHNPTAFTTDIAKQALLEPGIDYTEGEPFNNGRDHTAQILGDPIHVTIKVIDRIGFLTKAGASRWTYITMPIFIWHALNLQLKKQLIGWMYKHEGGVEMKGLFEQPS